MLKSPPDLAIVVVDYGAGNLRSVTRALEAVGQRPIVADDPATIARADGLVLPGVGSANDAMKALAARDLVGPLRDYAASNRPFLGVCVGLQVLFDRSDEGGGVDCLGIIRGTVKRFPVAGAAGLKVPHMGWNTVRFVRAHPLLEGVPDERHFYFVHSYYAEPEDPSVVVGVTRYGVDFPAVVAQAHLTAVQFHPEKSAGLGLRLYANFARQVANRQPASASR